jgi:hypothetical protein
VNEEKPMTRRLAVCVALAALGVAVTSGPAAAQDEQPQVARRESGLMRHPLGAIARQVKEFLGDRAVDGVSIGTFAGPPSMPSSAGPGLAMVLSEELEAVGVKVKRRAKVGVSGTYRPVEEGPPAANSGDYPLGGKTSAAKKLRGSVKVRLEDEEGKTLKEFEAMAYDPGDVAALFGLSYTRPANATRDRFQSDDEALADLAKKLKTPKVAIEGAQVRSSPDSPYAVEVLVKGPDGQFAPRAPQEDDGLAFVPLKRGEVFVIRLVNQSRLEMAVELSIDGLSTFAFSEVRQAKRWIVPPRQQILVRGWHVSTKELNEFLIGEYAKSALAELGGTPDKVGTITAKWVACWPKNAEPPEDEPKDMSITSMPPDLAGRGDKVKVNTQLVQREFGVPRSIVTVRYAK